MAQKMTDYRPTNVQGKDLLKKGCKILEISFLKSIPKEFRAKKLIIIVLKRNSRF